MEEFAGTDKILKISYMLNALIVQKMEKEKASRLL